MPLLYLHRMRTSALRPSFSSPVFRLYTSFPRSKPGPIPLGDAKAQREFEQLQKDHEKTLIQAETADLMEKRKRREQGLPEEKEDPSKADFKGDLNLRTGERGGPKGKEPTRYGDWERGGRVYDF